MPRTAGASAAVTIRMRCAMAPYLSGIVPPAVDDVDRAGEEVENVPPRRRAAAGEQRRQVGEERRVRLVIQRPPLGRQRHGQLAPIVRMIDPLDQPLALELIDDAGHRAETDVELGGELAHAAGALEVEDAEAVGL